MQRILVLFVFLLSVLSFYFLDRELCQKVGEPSYSEIHSFSLEWTHLADAKWYFIFAIFILALFGIHYLFRNRCFNSYKKLMPLYQLGKQFFVTLLASGVVIHFLKFLIGRKRPYFVLGDSGFGVCEADIFKPLVLDYTFHSFPSGHSQLIFTVATFLSYYLPYRSLKVVVFICAFGVALMRVGTRDHFLSDVLVGALVGFLVTHNIMKKIYISDRKASHL
jgi:membrane-associated phospholipid phosphatase